MDAYLNELSLSGQFGNHRDFFQAIEIVMKSRALLEANQARLYTCYHLRNRQATPTTNFTQEISAIVSRDQRISIFLWMDRSDWMSDRKHSGRDAYYYGTLDVVDHSIAEACHSRYHGVDACSLSFQGGGWDDEAFVIDWLTNGAEQQSLDIENYCSIEQITSALANRETLRRAAPIKSWNQLIAWSRNSCSNLVIADYVLDRLNRYPFVQAIAHQARECLHILNQLAGAVDASGRRTDVGNQLYDKHFTGDRAWFTDESDSNKIDFERDLTFVHPSNAQQRLFCPWHAKISHQYYRIHFSWPPNPTEPIYVVYIGQKLTKS